MFLILMISTECSDFRSINIAGTFSGFEVISVLQNAQIKPSGGIEHGKTDRDERDFPPFSLMVATGDSG